MTYTVLSGTLNSSIPYHTMTLLGALVVFLHLRRRNLDFLHTYVRTYVPYVRRPYVRRPYVPYEDLTYEDLTYVPYVRRRYVRTYVRTYDRTSVRPSVRPYVRPYVHTSIHASQFVPVWASVPVQATDWNDRLRRGWYTACSVHAVWLL